MLLNKLPCLDKGYVAYIDSSCNSEKLKAIGLEFFKKLDGKFLMDLANLTLVIKCPLFVQLNLSTHNLNVVSVPPTEVEAYKPNVGEIGAPVHATAIAIADDIDRTTEALLINPKAYQTDGCERSVSQILTPLSTYTTLVVYGSYNDWKKFCDQGNLPPIMLGYVNAVKQIMGAEWK